MGVVGSGGSGSLRITMLLWLPRLLQRQTVVAAAAEAAAAVAACVQLEPVLLSRRSSADSLI